MKPLRSLAIILFAAISLQAQAEIKSAFINPAIILSKAPQAIEASKQMEKEFKGKEQKLRELALSIQKAEQNYQKDASIMSDDQKKKLESEIVEKKRKLRFDQKSIQEDLALRRNQEIKKLQKTINLVIRAYAEKNGYDFIFSEGVAFASKKVDITDEILKELGK